MLIIYLLFTEFLGAYREKKIEINFLFFYHLQTQSDADVHPPQPDLQHDLGAAGEVPHREHRSRWRQVRRAWAQHVRAAASAEADPLDPGEPQQASS